MIPKKPFVVYRRTEPTTFTEHEDIHDALEAARRANIIPGAIFNEWLTTSRRCFLQEVLRV